MDKDAIIERQRVEIEQLKHELKELRRLIFGSKSEKHKSVQGGDPLQLSLFGDPQELESTACEKQTISYQRAKSKKKANRTEIPEHFPVEQIVLEPEQDTTDMVKVGQEVTRTVEYVPGVLKVIEYIRPKYAPKSKEGTFAIADLPSRALPKSIASESLLSWMLTRKFVEHMPIYRQRQALKRDHQWDLASSTVNDWFAKVCVLLDPLYEKLKTKVLSSGYVQVDESPIKVLDNEKKGSTHQGYQWVYYSPEQKTVFFDYRKGRGMNGPKDMLGDYTGLLQSDGYGVYDKIAARQKLTLGACLVHVRRYYSKAMDSDLTRATYALDIFKKIYNLERDFAKLSPAERKAKRDEQTLPLVQHINQWIEQESIKVLPKSPIGKAMTYTRNQWEKIMILFTNGRYQLDNNLIENKIRPLALGRKNYLFAGSHQGAKRIAMMYSFFGTCAAQNVNPAKWMEQTLRVINDTKTSQLETLLPGYQS